MRPMRFAIIGTGNIANTYVNALKALPETDLQAVVGRSVEKAQLFAHQHGIPHAVADIKDLKGQVDAVAIATPSGAHAQGIIAAAAQGMHVLTDKPLDVGRQAMDEAIAACEDHQVKLAVCFQRRFRPINKFLFEHLSQGNFGRVRAVDLSMKFYRPQSYYDSAAWRGTKALDGGGAFLNQGSHDIDLLCHLVGKPTSVIAQIGTLAHENIEVEDHGSAILTLPDGGIVSVVASTICEPGYSATMDVVTDRGAIRLENDHVVHWGIDGIAPPEASVRDDHDAATSVAVSDSSGHQAAIEDLLMAMQEDREPFIGGRSGRMATDVILAIYEAAAADRRIHIQ